MKYMLLLMTFVVAFSWITVTAIEQGRVYRIEHEKLIQEFIKDHTLPPDGKRIPGGVEIMPGVKRV